MGHQQEMIPTATFEYADGKTIVTDAEGGKRPIKFMTSRSIKSLILLDLLLFKLGL